MAKWLAIDSLRALDSYRNTAIWIISHFSVSAGKMSNGGGKRVLKWRGDCFIPTFIVWKVHSGLIKSILTGWTTLNHGHPSTDDLYYRYSSKITGNALTSCFITCIKMLFGKKIWLIFLLCLKGRMDRLRVRMAEKCLQQEILKRVGKEMVK